MILNMSGISKQVENRYGLVVHLFLLLLFNFNFNFYFKYPFLFKHCLFPTIMMGIEREKYVFSRVSDDYKQYLVCNWKIMILVLIKYYLLPKHCSDMY